MGVLDRIWRDPASQIHDGWTASLAGMTMCATKLSSSEEAGRQSGEGGLCAAAAQIPGEPVGRQGPALLLLDGRTEATDQRPHPRPDTTFRAADDGSQLSLGYHLLHVPGGCRAKTLQTADE